MIFSQPLFFPHYNAPSWDYGHKFNSNPEEEHRRISEMQDFGSDDTWLNYRTEGQIKNGNSDFGVAKQGAFVTNFRKTEDSNKNIHNVTNNYHEGRRKQSAFNFNLGVKEHADRGVSGIDNYIENNTDSLKGDSNSTEMRQNSGNFGTMNNRNGGFSDMRNRKIVTVVGKVKNDSDNSRLLKNHREHYSANRPNDKQNNLRLSDIGQVNNYLEVKSSMNENNRTVKHMENYRDFNIRNKNTFTTDSSNDRNINLGAHNVENNFEGAIRNSENNQNENPSFQNINKNVYNFQSEKNINNEFNLPSDITNERIQEYGSFQREKGDSGDINGRKGAREFNYNRHLENSRFGDIAWYRRRKPHGTSNMAQILDHTKEHNNSSYLAPWASTERPAYSIMKLNKDVENRHDSWNDNFNNSTWKDNFNSGKVRFPSASDDTAVDEGSQGTWEEINRLLPHRNRFANMKLQNNYHNSNEDNDKYQYYNQDMVNFSSTNNSDYGVAHIIEDVPIYEHGLHAGNKFGGKRWNSEYGKGGDQTFLDEEIDGEPIKNPRLGTRISTSAPTVVTTYTLPNGTRVVRLRRIVRFRRPGDEGEAKSFGDIAKNLVQKKLSKFLSLFTIIRFPNDPCVTSSGLNGTCYHQLECKSLGGISSGSCARGYGVCCYFESTCGAITKQNCSYFVNPGFPAPVTDVLACILTLQKSDPAVSQIRLDFFDFEILGPTNGTCIEDQFIVTGQNANSIAPIICGSNTGQHMYVDMDNTNGPLRLNMLIMGGNLPRSFRIKITQIKKGSPLEAPKNCLQYYRGSQGTIESFNYQIPTDSTLPTRPGYMNNLNYAICIRKEPGYCTITYTNTGLFQITNVDGDGMLVIPPGQAGAEVFNCPDDYIVINGIRLCGERLNDASVQLDFTQNAPVT
ncbi:hypothetical protein L9F63_013324, partial [Diploptera punctata]